MKRFSLVLLFALCQLAVWAQFRNVPLESTITTCEPFKGITFWMDNDDAHAFPTSYALEFAYCLPCDVVTGKQDGQIQYNWTKFEALLNDIQSRGHKAVIRFRYEYPSGEKINGVKGATAVPAYIKALPGYTETYKSNPGGDGPTYYADWSSAELMWFTKQFYTDLAARYDADPRLAYIQVGFGHWSEYHIYDGTDNPYRFGVNFPTMAYQREFLQHMANNTFQITPWSTSIDIAQSDHAPGTEAAIKALPFGLFDDSFMHKNHEIGSNDGYNEQLWIALNGLSQRWQTQPCGGEISYYASRDQKEFLRPNTGIYGISWEQASSKYHITYIIGNDCTEGNYGTASRVKEASQHAGYQFTITAYEVSSSEAHVTVQNTGIAPIYFDVYPTVNGVRSSQSLKGLLPGESLMCTIEGLLIADNDIPALTITGDKLYPNETIPYNAHLVLTGWQDTQINDRIEKIYEHNQLIINVRGEKYTILGTQIK